MKYTGKWYQRMFRYIQVKWFLLTKRYKPVEGGVNFYTDKRHNNVGVKGYYWKPMSYTVKTDLSWISKSQFDISNIKIDVIKNKPLG